VHSLVQMIRELEGHSVRPSQMQREDEGRRFHRRPAKARVCGREAAAVARLQAGRLDGGRAWGGKFLRAGDFMRGAKSCVFRPMFRSSATMIRADGLLLSHLRAVDFDPQPN